MEIQINQERPDTPEATALIVELDSYLDGLYPADSQYGYTVEKLVEENVAFFVVRCDGEAAGCGGIQLHGWEWGELKRIYVRPLFRGLKLGRRIIARLEDYACQHGVYLIRLETGIYQPEALALYKRCGYRSIPPFPPYPGDELGAYYEKRLD